MGTPSADFDLAQRNSRFVSAVAEHAHSSGALATVDSLAVPIAWLLAVRWAEVEDADRAAMAAFNGETHEPILPTGFSWARLVDGGLARADVVNIWSRVHHALGLASVRAMSMRAPPTVSQDILTEMIRWVRALPFDTPADRRAAGEAFSDLLQRIGKSSRHAGEYTSPAGLVRMAIALADPRPGERVYDPCFGMGSLLVGAASRIWEHGRSLSAGEWARAVEQPLFGVDINSSAHVVAFVRVMLAGFRPGLEHGDALERSAAGRHHQQGFDVVLANPPWGGRAAHDRLDSYDFAFRTRSIEGLFLQHVAESLRPGGRAVVALPQGPLFRGGVDEEIRKWLYEGFCLDRMVTFPAGAFKDFTAIPITLLHFRKAPPPDATTIVELNRAPASDIEARDAAAGSASRGSIVQGVHRLLPSQVRESGYRFTIPEDEPAYSVAIKRLGQHVALRTLASVAAVSRGHRAVRGELLEPVGDARLGEDPAVPYVRVADLLGDSVQLGNAFLVPGHPRSGKVNADDLLVSLSGSVGKTGAAKRLVWADGMTGELQRGPRGAFVASRDIAIVTPGEEVDREYLLGVLRSGPIQASLRALGRGTTLRHVTLEGLRSLSIPVPDLATQARVMRQVAAQGGDVLEILESVVSAETDDALTRWLADHSRAGRVGEAGEVARSTGSVRELLRGISAADDRVASDAPPIPKVLKRWQATLKGLEAALGDGEPTFANLGLAETVLEAAQQELAGATERGALHARRLTAALVEWVATARAVAAAAHRLVAVHVPGTRVVRLLLDGPAGLRGMLVSVIPGAGFAIEVGDLAAGEIKEIEVEFVDEQLLTGDPDDVRRFELFWTALQLDGVEVDGSLVVSVRKGVEGEVRDDRDVDIGASPYKPGDVIESATLFKGRQDVIDTVLRHLRGGVKVILLEGNRRAGKTSILRRLRAPEWNLGEEWVIVECSFQGVTGSHTSRGVPTSEVFRLLIEEIGATCAKAGWQIPLPNMPESIDPRRFRAKFVDATFDAVTSRDPYTVLRSYVDDVAEVIAPRKLLFMLDEFDVIQEGIDAGVTSPQVPENIRHLLQTRPATAAILTGSRRLKRLREEYWSALFGFGYRVPVLALDPAAARELVVGPVEGRVRYDEDVVSAILAETARQPFIIQFVCAKIFDLLAERRRDHATRDLLEEALARVVADYEHLTALWGYAGRRDLGPGAPQCGERRRYELCAIDRLSGGPDRLTVELLRSRLDAQGLVVSPKDLHADLDSLVELELVETVTGGAGPEYRIAIPLLARWMRTHQDYQHQLQLALEERREGKTT